MRHNTATERLKAQELEIRERLETLDAYIQADENEKKRVMDLVMFAAKPATKIEANY